MTPEEHQMLQTIATQVGELRGQLGWGEENHTRLAELETWVKDLGPAVAEVKAAVTAIQAGTPVAHTHPITANTGDPYK